MKAFPKILTLPIFFTFITLASVLLITPQASADDLNSQLLDAIKSGRSDIVEKLLEEDIDVNITHRGQTPLMIAASKGHTYIVKMLLDKGAEINVHRSNDVKWGWTPLVFAAGWGHIDIMNILIENGADVNAANGSALKVAAEHGRDDIVKYLLKVGADVNAGNNTDGDNIGSTALMVASKEGHMGIVKLLLKKGADVNVKDTNGRNAYTTAILRKHPKIAEVLLSAMMEQEKNNEKPKVVTITKQNAK